MWQTVFTWRDRQTDRSEDDDALFIDAAGDARCRPQVAPFLLVAQPACAVNRPTTQLNVLAEFFQIVHIRMECFSDEKNRYVFARPAPERCRLLYKKNICLNCDIIRGTSTIFVCIFSSFFVYTVVCIIRVYCIHNATGLSIKSATSIKIDESVSQPWTYCVAIVHLSTHVLMLHFDFFVFNHYMSLFCLSRIYYSSDTQP